MWIIGFVILFESYIIELATCYDHLAMNAGIKVDPAVMEYLKQSLDDELELGYFRGNDDPDVSAMEIIKDNALHELLKDELPEIAGKGNVILTKIHIYEERAQQKGVESFEAIANHVETKLNLPRAKLTPIVKTITSDYISLLKKYFTDLAKEKPKCRVDEEYIILDMFNVVPLIRANIEKKLLRKFFELAPNAPDDEIDIITGTVLTFIDNDRVQEIDYMCARFKVCRPNPPFSDYLYKLLEVVLNLNDARFRYVIVKCSELLLKKESFFTNLLQNELVTSLLTKMNIMANDMVNVTEMRDVVSFLHSIVMRRYKLNRLSDYKILTKAKSSYIMFDIVDIAFGIDGHDLYGTQLDKTITSITGWSTDVEASLFDLIQYIIEAMNYNLTQRARDEIMTLADIIFYDDSDENKRKIEYLWTEGSKFVNGLVNRPEPKKLW